MVRTLKGHGHWVNHLALSSEHALRTGAFDHYGRSPSNLEEAKQAALDRSLPQQRLFDSEGSGHHINCPALHEFIAKLLIHGWPLLLFRFLNLMSSCITLALSANRRATNCR